MFGREASPHNPSRLNANINRLTDNLHSADVTSLGASMRRDIP